MANSILLIFAAAALTACQSNGTSESRWRDMQVDIAFKNRYQHYSCGYHALHGYSKDSGWRTERVATRKVKRPAPAQAAAVLTVDSSKQAEEQIRELTGKIAVLEEALKANVAATNQNQNLLVDQINSLRQQVAELADRKTAALKVQEPTRSGISIPQN
jgi:hypothetical protein